MARNDIVLLDSLIDKSRGQLGATREESELFELFAFDQLLKEYDPSYEELESGWTDGGNDGGIDGFFIFVDGRVATPDVSSYALKKHPEINLIIFTVKRSPTFEQKPLDSLISSLAEILDLGIENENLKYPYNDTVLEQRRLFSEVYISLADRHPIVNIDVHYCSRGDSSKVAINLKSRAETLQANLLELFSDAQVKTDFVGASELLAIARKQKDFTLRLPYIENYISREGQNYILLCTLSAYFKFISDGFFKWGSGHSNILR